MELDRLVRDAEPRRDSLVRQAFRDKLEHFDFARRQRFHRECIFEIWGGRRRGDDECVCVDVGASRLGKRAELAHHVWRRRLDLFPQLLTLSRRAYDD